MFYVRFFHLCKGAKGAQDSRALPNKNCEQTPRTSFEDKKGLRDIFSRGKKKTTFLSRAIETSRVAKRGGFPIWTCPSFLFLFCPFWDFPDFLVFSRFARGWSGDFLDLSFSSFSAYEEHVRGTVPKGSATQSGPFPKKVGNPPGLETPPVYHYTQKDYRTELYYSRNNLVR